MIIGLANGLAGQALNPPYASPAGDRSLRAIRRQETTPARM